MYCSHCGSPAGGNFCASCGKPLAGAAAAPRQPLAPDGWIDEICYENLLRYEYVRQRIAESAKRVRKTVKAEELLAVVDALVPTGISLEKLTGALVPLYDRLGIRTATQEQLSLDVPAGKALLALLCALIARGMQPTEVEQMVDGCKITAAVSSTLITNPGEIVVTLQRQEQNVQFHAAVKIMGQWYDWGKSKRLVAELLTEIRTELVSDLLDPPQRTSAA